MLSLVSADSLKIRQLPEEEWERLREIYEANGDVLPPPDNQTAIVAEVDGKIVGVWGINVQVHAGPLWVDPKWRGLGVPDRMGDALDELVRGLGGKGYLTFPSNAQSERVMQRRGLELKDWKVYVKEF